MPRQTCFLTADVFATSVKRCKSGRDSFYVTGCTLLDPDANFNLIRFLLFSKGNGTCNGNKIASTAPCCAFHSLPIRGLWGSCVGCASSRSKWEVVSLASCTGGTNWPRLQDSPLHRDRKAGDCSAMPFWLVALWILVGHMIFKIWNPPQIILSKRMTKTLCNLS